MVEKNAAPSGTPRTDGKPSHLAREVFANWAQALDIYEGRELVCDWKRFVFFTDLAYYTGFRNGKEGSQPIECSRYRDSDNALTEELIEHSMSVSGKTRELLLRASALSQQLKEAQADAHRWVTFCELWAASTELKVSQEENGFWAIVQIEPCEAAFKPLYGETPDATIDIAAKHLALKEAQEGLRQRDEYIAEMVRASHNSLDVNEDSSVTQAEVLPSAGGSGTQEEGAWTCKACGFVGFWRGGPHCGPGSENHDEGSRELIKNLLGLYPKDSYYAELGSDAAARIEELEVLLSAVDNPRKAWGAAWRWKLTPVRIRCAPENVAFPFSPPDEGPSDECPVCTLKGQHGHSVEDIERLRQMVAFLESKLGTAALGMEIK